MDKHTPAATDIGALKDDIQPDTASLLRQIQAGRAGHPALSREVLTDVIDIALWAGRLLMRHGAESQRVEETVYLIGTALGCDSMDVFVAPDAIHVTVISGGEFRTKVRRVVDRGVNMTIVSAVNRLSRRTVEKELGRHEVRTELERITNLSPHYNRWIVVGMVGLACAAFSRLFGGDWPTFGVTLVASAVGMFVRQELTRHTFNTLLVVAATAFVTGLLASTVYWFSLSARPTIALSAAVLFLVPGVPLINAVEDLVKGHPSVGLARAASGALIALALAIGLVLAIQIAGVTGL